MKTIAAFEAIKGLLVVLIGFGILAFVGRDLQRIGEEVVSFLHMNPAHRYPKIFLHSLSSLQGKNLKLLALGAIFYSILRFVEAYGLWLRRNWAGWMAIISTTAYLPIEFFDLWQKPTLVRAVITLLNLCLLAYLIKVRRRHVLKFKPSLPRANE